MRFNYQPIDKEINSKVGPSFLTRKDAAIYLNDKFSKKRRKNFAIADLRNYTDSSMTKLKINGLNK